jgi:hypothetical protein
LKTVTEELERDERLIKLEPQQIVEIFKKLARTEVYRAKRLQ